MILFSKITIPSVPPNESKKPTSKIINGLYSNNTNEAKAIEDNVSGCFENKSDNITHMAMIPALKTDGDAPEINAKEIITNIEMILDVFFPTILSSKNFVAITI